MHAFDLSEIGGQIRVLVRRAGPSGDYLDKQKCSYGTIDSSTARVSGRAISACIADRPSLPDKEINV